MLFYEMMVSKPPFDNRYLLQAGYEEMRRIIREVDPADLYSAPSAGKRVGNGQPLTQSEK